MDYATELSEEEEICASLDCEGVISESDAQRPDGSVSAVELAVNGVEVVSVNLEVEVLRNPGFFEAKVEPPVVPVEKMD